MSRAHFVPKFPWTALLLVAGGVALAAAGCGEEKAGPPAVDVTRDAGTSATAMGTCRDLKNCRLGCTDPVCERTCDAQAKPAAKALYDATMACVMEHGCTTELCAEQKCGALVNLCLDRPLSTGAFSCRDLKDCRRGCADDLNCDQMCLAKASPGVKEAYDAVESCRQANACTDETCIEAKCKAVLDVCLGRDNPDGGRD
jgi:hypothetical protein